MHELAPVFAFILALVTALAVLRARSSRFEAAWQRVINAEKTNKEEST